MKIIRNTEVVSISLPPSIARKIDRARKDEGRTRSSFFRALIDRYLEDSRWERIYRHGQATARKFNINSEEDIDKILHGS